MCHARLATFAMTLCLLLAASAIAQPQPVKEVGFTYQRNKCLNSKVTNRRIEYAVLPNTYAPPKEFTNKPFCVDYAVKALELNTGHAYVTIDDVPESIAESEQLAAGGVGTGGSGGTGGLQTHAALKEVLGLISFPFILSRRTVGGAEGSQIVTYVHEIDADTADVYYLYLYTEHAQRPMKVLAPQGASYSVPTAVSVGDYARVALTRVNGDWVLLTSISTGHIADLEPTGHVRAAAKAAFNDACAAGLQPHPPHPACGLNWTCP